VGFVRVLDVACTTHFFRRKITLAEGGRKDAFSLPGLSVPFLDRPVDLWSPNADQAFASTFGKSGIADALDRRMFNRPEPIVLRIGAGEEASVPWEAFQQKLDPSNRRKLAPLRLVDPSRAFRFSTVPSEMRVLVLVGHPGAEPAFDPAVAQNFLENTLSAARAASGRKGPTVAVQLRVAELPQVAAVAGKLAPNVLLYFGHGRRSRGPELLLGASDGGWTPLGTIAQTLFPKPQSRPPFWIFWACSLAEGSDQPISRLEGPEALRALGVGGGVAVLAMRSRIRVSTARAMLEALIGAFAAGEPLEVAAAIARTAAVDINPEAGGRMDYAAPAVWSLSEPVDRINWGAEAAFPASWVALPLITASGDLPELATGLAPVDAAATALAETWARPGRYFVSTQGVEDVGEDPAARTRLLGAAASIRRETGRPVVPIVPRAGATFGQRLALWAKDAHAQFDPRYHDRELALAIGAMADDGLHGLAQLLAAPGVVVILSEPPDRAAVWELLSNAPGGASVIVVGSAPPDEVLNWTLDQLTADVLDRDLDDVAEAEPLGCAILCVVERPLALREVERLAGAGSGALDRLEPALVRVGGRRVFSETARRHVHARLSKEIVAAAHQACIHLLSQRPVGSDFEAVVEICQHHLALEAGESGAETVNAAWRAAGAAWTIPQRARLFKLAARRRDLLDGLEDGTMLDLAEAGVVVQHTRPARQMLERRAPRLFTDRARWHAMLAECLKAEVADTRAQTAMRRHAEDAVACAVAAAPSLGARAAIFIAHHRHNLARIHQYFDHEYEAAIQTYEAIRNALAPDVSTDRESAQLFAAASRNAAECVLDPAPRPIAQSVRDRADEFAGNGLKVARTQGLGEIEAELIYTRARIDEAAQDYAGAGSLLSDLANGCTARAHPLVSAIAADRLAWNEVRRGRRNLTWEDLRARLRTLDLFDHAWAARVAIKSRLRGAKRLAAKGRQIDLLQAQQLLEENRRRLGEMAGLAGREDARGAARTYAGLDVLAQAGGRLWAEFLASPRAVRLPDDWKDLTPHGVWETVD
jgi:hypothetical protein